MRKVHAYLIGGSLIITSAIISYSCTKSTKSDTTLIGNWKKANDFGGDARSEAVSFTIGDYAYVTTGVDLSSRFQDLWEYNVARNFWQQKMSFQGAARNSAVAFSIGTKGYVGTGYDGVNLLNDFWEYDQASNQWTAKAPLPDNGRQDAVGFAVGGKGYIATGNDGKFLNSMWQYDPGTNAWLQKASVGGSKRSAAMAFVVGNNAYVCSGVNNGEIQRDLQMYDPSTDTWIEKTRIDNFSEESFDDDYASIPRQNGVTFTIGNYVYLTGGENGSITSATWQYDATSDRWTQKTAFEGTGRTGAVGFGLSGHGYVLTGRSGSLIFDNVYELLPNDDRVDGD